MKKRKNGVKESRFPLSLFWVTLVILLVTGGVHQGLLIGLERTGWAAILLVHIIVLYWLAAAAGLAYVIMRTIRRVYDEPLREISDATKRIAKGDFSVRVTPTHTGDQIDYLDVMASDINTMTEELGSIETLKTDFISNISHELKTPLSVISNYGRLLRSDTIADEDRIEYAKSIIAASQRMSELITNILRLNRLENQRLGAKKEAFDLGMQLGECLLPFESVWEEKDIELDAELADGIWINSDAELLNLVWNNLLSNAFKFTEAGGTVGVSLWADAEYATVRVTDTGCGMSEETMRHIFDKFYQGDTSRATQGNGLGLALVKRVLAILDGEISVSSTPEKGSTFTAKIKRNDPIGE